MIDDKTRQHFQHQATAGGTGQKAQQFAAAAKQGDHTAALSLAAMWTHAAAIAPSTLVDVYDGSAHGSAQLFSGCGSLRFRSPYGFARSSRTRCIKTRSSQRPNLCPTWGIRDFCKAKSLVETDRGAVVAVDCADEHVDAIVLGPHDQCLQQDSSDSVCPLLLSNVNRVLGGECVARPLPGATEMTVCAKADYSTVHVGHEHGKPIRVLTVEPCTSLCDCLT